MNKISEAVLILKKLGLPKDQQNERSGLTLLALGNLKDNAQWSKAQKRNIRIHDILVFVQEHYGKHYAENTRETIRRQTLHQFEQAGVVVRNADDKNRPTNSPNTVYALSTASLSAIRNYGGPNWEKTSATFLQNKGSLVERYEKRKEGTRLSINLTDDKAISFSPGKHNELQVKILSEFRNKFCPNASVAYVGDTAKKLLYKDDGLLKRLKVKITEHDKLPDVILYEHAKNHMFLIEAVTAHGPMSSKRQIELEEMLEHSAAERIYVSAFPDFREFKRHIDNIAWDTEVWIENKPEHMIHFNGEQFFNAYK